MNKSRVATLSFVLVLVLVPAAGAGCSSIRTVETAKLRKVEAAELKAGADAEQLFRDSQPTVVIARAGQSVPLTLKLDVPFARLASGEEQLVFTRDTYVYIARDTLMVGFDGTRFAPVGDWAAIRKLAGAGKGGTIQIGASVTKEAGLRLNASLEAK